MWAGAWPQGNSLWRRFVVAVLEVGDDQVRQQDGRLVRMLACDVGQHVATDGTVAARNLLEHLGVYRLVEPHGKAAVYLRGMLFAYRRETIVE